MATVIDEYILAAKDFAFLHGGLGAKTNVKVLYPDTSGFAQTIAEAFTHAIATRFDAHVDLVRATRTGNRWYLHASAWTRGFVGFVVDWGAVTTSTVRDLAHELAAAG